MNDTGTVLGGDIRGIENPECDLLVIFVEVLERRVILPPSMSLPLIFSSTSNLASSWDPYIMCRGASRE